MVQISYLGHCLQKQLRPPETPVSSGEVVVVKTKPASPSCLPSSCHVFPLWGGHTLWVPHQSQAEPAAKLLGLQNCELNKPLFPTDDLASGILVLKLNID